jgi:hypothetical protein
MLSYDEVVLLYVVCYYILESKTVISLFRIIFPYCATWWMFMSTARHLKKFQFFQEYFSERHWQSLSSQSS